MSVRVAIRNGADSDSDEALLERLLADTDLDARDDTPDVAVTGVEEESDLVLTVGDDALRSLVDDPAPVPTLPVGTTVGRHGLTRERVGSFLADLSPADLDMLTVSHPVLSVEVGSDEAWALFDVALVTSEPAHISEYTVAAGSGMLGSFRADGVVVATAVGSAGYSHATGGPILAADSGLAVVPISPYTTKPRTWVVDAPVTLDVERDEVPVSLVVDGRESRRVTVDEPVRLSVARTVDLIRPATPTERARRLEKL